MREKSRWGGRQVIKQVKERLVMLDGKWIFLKHACKGGSELGLHPALLPMSLSLCNLTYLTSESEEGRRERKKEENPQDIKAFLLH